MDETEIGKIKTYKVKPRFKKWGRKYEDERLKSTKQTFNRRSRFPDRMPIPEEKLQKYSTGIGLDKTGVKTEIHRKRLERKEINIKFATELAARAEILLTEDSG